MPFSYMLTPKSPAELRILYRYRRENIGRTHLKIQRLRRLGSAIRLGWNAHLARHAAALSRGIRATASAPRAALLASAARVAAVLAGAGSRRAEIAGDPHGHGRRQARATRCVGRYLCEQSAA